ncbi:MAG: hypothetical protein AUF69_00150, partial [Gemmatimonadetes bacterium 13_1_20CM_66_74]
LDDIDKSTVDFVPNFDDRLQEPTVLPARLPNLIVNGTSGIAVGMATNIPPHNLAETVEAINHLVDHPDASIKDLRKFIKGPDFPTGAIVYGRDGIKECYEKGRGRIVLRARAVVEEKESSGKQQIVVTEIPYQVNKANLIAQIAQLANDKKLDGISDIQDYSDREGMRIVIDLKRDAVPAVVLNQLYKHTQMQTTFGAIMLALVDGAPKEMALKELLEHFIEHRHTVITRRTEFELKRAQDREHILEGLKIAVDHIDEVVKIIRKAKDVPTADAALRKRFKLSEKQAAEILNMRLARLTALEITKLEDELKELRKFIKECKEILGSKPRRLKILKEELSELAHGFGDERRTEIVADQGEFSMANLIAQIAQLANDKKLDGISDIQDYSDREGMRIVIDLKRDAVPAVVLNQLYKHTQMQTTFGAIMLALVDGAPKEMALKELLEHFIEHRHTVITRRTEFELKRAQDREHILEGLKIAVDHIDEVVKIIRKAKDVPTADAALRKRFKLSEKQAAEILNMRLARLTALEITKLEDELKELRKFIKECKEILGSKPRRLKILKEELSELAHGFGDERRTEIVADQGEFSIEDLIAEEDMVITVSHAGYIKRLPVSAYRRQRRGGKGVISAHTKEDDWLEHLFIASTHDYVMFFTQQGQCYWLKVHEIPQAARAARGKPIISCVAMKPDERLAALVPVREFSEDQFLLFATTQGVVKKTVLSEFGNPRSVGIRAINIEKGDELIDVQVTDGRNDIVLATRHGMSIRFHEKDVRDMGRTATGVKGIELDKKDHVIDMVVVRRKSTLLVVTEKGMGKRSELDEYRVQ